MFPRPERPTSASRGLEPSSSSSSVARRPRRATHRRRLAPRGASPKPRPSCARRVPPRSAHGGALPIGGRRNRFIRPRLSKCAKRLDCVEGGARLDVVVSKGGAPSSHPGTSRRDDATKISRNRPRRAGPSCEIPRDARALLREAAAIVGQRAALLTTVARGFDVALVR